MTSTMPWPGYAYLVSRHVEGEHRGEIRWTAYHRLDDRTARRAQATAESIEQGEESAKEWLRAQAKEART